MRTTKESRKMERMSADFIMMMCKRFAAGHRKYKDSWKTRNNIVEAQAELVDCANYCMMEYMRLEMMNNGKLEKMRKTR